MRDLSGRLRRAEEALAARRPAEGDWFPHLSDGELAGICHAECLAGGPSATCPLRSPSCPEVCAGAAALGVAG